MKSTKTTLPKAGAKTKSAPKVNPKVAAKIANKQKAKAIAPKTKVIVKGKKKK